MIRYAIVPVLAMAGIMSAQPSVTITIPAQLGPLVSCAVPTQCPVVAPKNAGLIFPDGKTTRVRVQVVLPEHLDFADLMQVHEVRALWVKKDGGTGQNLGGVCQPIGGASIGQCWKLFIRTALLLDGTNTNSPPFGPEVLTDVLPAGGVNALNKKYTATARTVTIDTTAVVDPSKLRFNPVVHEFTRYATGVTPDDNYTGNPLVTAFVFEIRTVQ